MLWNMKKFFRFSPMLRLTAIMIILANIRTTHGQPGKNQQFLIPENINKIFQTSCMPCHGSNGGRLPKSRLSFYRWAGYGAARETEKALLICSSVSKGKMPPKSARESNPELIPTKEQVDLICNWAESLKSEKKEKNN